MSVHRPTASACVKVLTRRARSKHNAKGRWPVLCLCTVQRHVLPAALATLSAVMRIGLAAHSTQLIRWPAAEESAANRP